MYDIGPSAFSVLDGGVPRHLRDESATGSQGPFKLAVIVRTGGILPSGLKTVGQVGLLLQSPLGTDGIVSVITYSDQINVVREFTGEVSTTLHSLHSSAMGGD